jgi:hypothetical protein
MHYHLEIIMPHTNDIEEQIKKILEPYYEGNEDPDKSHHAFWDFWTIGGRFSGSKLMAQFDEDKLQAFYDELNKHKITVSSIQCGKQEISPASQIPLVDKLWQKYFPETDNMCPIFKHSNDQYDSNDLICGDIITVENIPERLTASRVIISDGEKASFMIERDYWNGVTWNDTSWNGKVLSAIKLANEEFKHYNERAQERYIPKDNWLVVTVDYHS